MNAEDKLKKIQELVNIQAEDKHLWSVPFFGKQSLSEEYLQNELYKLHQLIEASDE